MTTVLTLAVGAALGACVAVLGCSVLVSRGWQAREERWAARVERQTRRADAFRDRAIERNQERAAVEAQNAALREQLAAKRPCDSATCGALRRELDATRRIAGVQAAELDTLRGDLAAERAARLRHTPKWEAS